MAALAQVQPLKSKWQVAQQKDRKTRPLKDVLEGFKSKVIAAARKSQQQLANSAEQPDTPATAEQSEIDARRRKRNSEVDDSLASHAAQIWERRKR